MTANKMIQGYSIDRIGYSSVLQREYDKITKKEEVTIIGERVKRVVYRKIGISEMDISEIDAFPIH